MVDRGAAERACKDANPIIDGRKANVNLAYLGAKPRSTQSSKSISYLDLQLHISMLFQLCFNRITANNSVHLKI